MKKDVRISVVIITFNEESNISRCIRSAEKVADDITVVDSFSTDRTCDIARELGADVIEQKFLGHVEQKNFAITKAKYPHILSLDADEALDNDLISSILEMKQNWDCDGYYMNRLTNYCGKWIRHSGWYPDRKLRLWDSSKGTWRGTNPHDEFILDEGAAKKRIKGNILHYSYDSIADHIKQVNYFTDIAAKSQLMNGKKSPVYKLLLSPAIKFIKDYFLNLGMLDGHYGLIICIISAHATFLKYAKMREFKNSDFSNAYSPQSD